MYVLQKHKTYFLKNLTNSCLFKKLSFILIILYDRLFAHNISLSNFFDGDFVFA